MIYSPVNGATSKLALDLPLLDFALRQPVVMANLVFGAAIFLGFFSLHYALGILVLLTGYMALYLERRYVSEWLVSPLFLCMIPHLLGNGLGIPLYIFGIGVMFDDALFQVQLNCLLSFAFVSVGYFLTRGNHEVLPLRLDIPVLKVPVLQPLIKVGWVLYLLCIFTAWAAAISGAGDRGFAGDFTAENPFGWWSIFQAFRNSGGVGLLLFPLIFTNSRGLGRTFLSLTLLLHLALAFASGSRESFLAPLVLLGVGGYVFRGSRKFRLQTLALLFIPVALTAFYFILLFRNTQSFSDTRQTALADRISAVKQVGEVDLDPGANFYTTTGLQLLEVSDAVIYTATPSIVPYAGWENLDAVIWTWVPFFLYRDRPVLLDGNAVVSFYTGAFNDRSSTKISLEGDLYRRFGEVGVMAGAFTFGIIYGLYIRFVFQTMNFSSALMGIVGYLLLLTYFRAGLKNQTMLTTWWQFAYDIPKNFIPVAVATMMLSAPTGMNLIKGMLRGIGTTGQALMHPLAKSLHRRTGRTS